MQITYTINDKETSFKWKVARDGGAVAFSIDDRVRRTVGRTPLPDNIIVYYSGQNAHVAEIVTRLENRFRNNIKGAHPTESPRFIGIGPAYNKLLILLLLVQPDDTPYLIFLSQKLGILGNGGRFKLHLTKPIFARKPHRVEKLSLVAGFGFDLTISDYVLDVLCFVRFSGSK